MEFDKILEVFETLSSTVTKTDDYPAPLGYTVFLSEISQLINGLELMLKTVSVLQSRNIEDLNAEEALRRCHFLETFNLSVKQFFNVYRSNIRNLTLYINKREKAPASNNDLNNFLDHAFNAESNQNNMNNTLNTLFTSLNNISEPSPPPPFKCEKRPKIFHKTRVRRSPKRTRCDNLCSRLTKAKSELKHNPPKTQESKCTQDVVDDLVIIEKFKNAPNSTTNSTTNSDIPPPPPFLPLTPTRE